MKTLIPILAILCLATAWPAWFAGQQQVADLPAEAADKYLGIELDSAQEASDLFGSIGSVEVSTWNEEETDVDQIVVVSNAEDGWVISSKFDYPADGEAKVGKAASHILGVEKGLLVAKSAERHASLGVVDPKDESLLATEGRGTRVTIKDRDGQLLADVIVGNRVPDTAPGWYYVREADNERVYRARLVPPSIDEEAPRATQLHLSSRFIDWVKPGPFEIEQDAVRSLAIDKYSIDESTGTLQDKQSVRIRRSSGTEEWQAAELPPGKELKTDEVSQILRTLANLRLADIDQYRGLGQLELQARGFYLGQQGGLYANQGGIRVTTSGGLLYHLFFGGVLRTVTSGVGEADEVGENEEEKNNDRYLFVAVSYDQSVDEKLPKTKPVEGKPLSPEEEKEHQKKVAKHLQERHQLITDLNRKYQNYFFIIRDSDFKTLRPDLSRLTKDAAPKPIPSAADPEPETEADDQIDSEPDVGAAESVAPDAESEPAETTP